MKKSFNQLKKDLKNHEGGILKVLYHFRSEENSDLLLDRKILKVQSNALTTIKLGNTIAQNRECWLYYPTSAELVDYVDNVFTIYEMGERELTEQEKILLDKMEHITTEKEKELDRYTDSNYDYWNKKKFAKENNCEHLLGYEYIKGEKYNWRTKKITSNKVKGQKLYSFEIV